MFKTGTASIHLPEYLPKLLLHLWRGPIHSVPVFNAWQHEIQIRNGDVDAAISPFLRNTMYLLHLGGEEMVAIPLEWFEPLFLFPQQYLIHWTKSNQSQDTKQRIKGGMFSVLKAGVTCHHYTQITGPNLNQAKGNLTITQWEECSMGCWQIPVFQELLMYSILRVTHKIYGISLAVKPEPELPGNF